MPSCEILRKYATAAAESDQCDNYRKPYRESDHQIQHIQPAEVGKPIAEPIQRPDRATPCHPKACQHGQHPAEECADTLATLSSLFDFAHKRHNSGTPRMNFTSLTLSVQRFASWAATLDAYELRSGRHSRPSGRAHRRFNHRTARFRMPDDFSYG